MKRKIIASALLGLLIGALPSNNSGRNKNKNELRVQSVITRVQEQYFPELNGRRFEAVEDNNVEIANISPFGTIRFNNSMANLSSEALGGVAAHELSHAELGHTRGLSCVLYFLSPPSLRKKYENEADSEVRRRGLGEELDRYYTEIRELKRNLILNIQYKKY